MNANVGRDRGPMSLAAFGEPRVLPAQGEDGQDPRGTADRQLHHRDRGNGMRWAEKDRPS